MPASSKSRMALFFESDTASGLILMAAAVMALVLVNSPWQWLYAAFLETSVAIAIGPYMLSKPLALWINDGLMAVFFLYVSLEIKHELVEGDLSTWKQASLPAIAAGGGMLLPAILYIAINADNPGALRGWAIPTATDIAFAVGALALLGTRVPAALKVFLLALAILDDLGAIAIIAVFYTADLSLALLALAAAGAGLLAVLNRLGVRSFLPYLAIGGVMWLCVLDSGVHPTMTGVVVAAFIPLHGATPRAPSPLHRLKDLLKPWVTLGIMPIFGFANAGLSLSGISPSDLLSPIPLGIATGLFLGKQVGIFGLAWTAVRFKICALPADVTWRQLYGVAIIAGIGFTMSLFIGTLAFSEAAEMAVVRLGVLTGSLLSGATGYLFLRASAVSTRERPLPEMTPTRRMRPVPRDRRSPAAGAVRHLSPRHAAASASHHRRARHY